MLSALLLLLAFVAVAVLAWTGRVRAAVITCGVALAVWVLIGMLGATITTN